MKKAITLSLVGLMFASSLAIAQDAPPPNPVMCPVSVGPFLVAVSIDGTYVTDQVIDMDGDCYRWWDDDVDTAFKRPFFSGCKLQSATLTMKFGDVDFYDQDAWDAELDVVDFDGALDVLKGSDNTWETMSWDVADRVLGGTITTAHIPFGVNVDAAHHDYHWWVYLDTARLHTTWSCPVPDPIEEQLAK